jgi:GNAT superfamily N-acetyltransferase
MNLTLRPMTDNQFDSWRESSMRNYAQEFVDSGALAPADAERSAAADFERLLPDGLATAPHDLWTAVDDGEPVGVLWLFTKRRAAGPESFIYELSVREDKRRRGYGRAIMLAAVDVCGDAVSFRWDSTSSGTTPRPVSCTTQLASRWSPPR